MFKVGITGGIGSGKSTVANIFMKLGIPVFFSDIEAAKLISTKKKIRQKIIREFGNEVLFRDKIDRKKLAEMVFADYKKLLKLNSIVHPAIRGYFKIWVKKQKKFPFVIQEAAILIETGGYKNLDFVILITAPKQMRIERVMKRDSVSRKEVLHRLRNQWSDRKKKEFADALIVNDEKKMLLPQVLKIHLMLLQRFS